jgi:hypothetical protein
MENHEIEDPDNMFRALMEKLTEELGHIGVHAESMTIVGSPILDEDGEEQSPEDFTTEDILGRIKEDSGRFAIAATAKVGELAFDERTLDPDGYAQKTQEEIVMPSMRDMIQADVRAWMEEHGSIDGYKIPDIFKELPDEDQED